MTTILFYWKDINFFVCVWIAETSDATDFTNWYNSSYLNNCAVVVAATKNEYTTLQKTIYL